MKADTNSRKTIHIAWLTTGPQDRSGTPVALRTRTKPGEAHRQRLALRFVSLLPLLGLLAMGLAPSAGAQVPGPTVDIQNPDQPILSEPGQGGGANEPGVTLQVTRQGPDHVRIHWRDPSGRFVLQSCTRLEDAVWVDIGFPVRIEGEESFVVVPKGRLDRYYRLRDGCLDFSTWNPGVVPNPLELPGLTFLTHDFSGSPSPTGQILDWGAAAGLDVGFRMEIKIEHPWPAASLTLASFSAPAVVYAYDETGVLLDTGTTGATTGAPVLIFLNGFGRSISRIIIDAPQDETILVNICCREPANADGEPFNPFGVPVQPAFHIHGVPIDEKGQPGQFEVFPLPEQSIYREPNEVDRKDDEPQPQPPQKLSPILADWLANRDPNDIVELILTFPDDIRMPLLPELGPNEDREKGLTRRGLIIDELKDLRLQYQLERLERIAKTSQVRVDPLESFWIVNAVMVQMRLGDVGNLLESQDVQYPQPVEGGERPPADGNPDNDAQDGRALIVSDPYFNLGLTTPWIGLLDTGVRDTHIMFNSPRHIAWMRDCVNGGPNCNNTSNPGYDPTDFAWNHGTSSAGILTGNSRSGAAFRGVTEIRMDSWQIYTAAGLNGTAAVRGIQSGVAAFDKVLVGEIQAVEADNGAIATAADNAYNAGVIFVSANGNYGPDTATVASPGIAHKVLGIGGFMTDGGAQYGNQGRGPANDGRFKPDLQAPTWSETASASSDTALQVFTGTSGATPYAAGAAMLSRNWLHQFGTYDNGQTYAFMILYGDDPYPYDNTVGAGRIRMAVNGHAWWGKLTVPIFATINIPITVGTGKRNFDVALWWPESASQPHNDIDVHLIDPSGVERARGYSAASVFERAAVPGTLTPGTWQIRIRGYNVRTLLQTVYWAAHIQN